MKEYFKLNNQELYRKLCDTLENFDVLFEQACQQQWNDGHDNVVVCNNLSGANSWEYTIAKNDIECTEPLKPYVWYPAEMFDHNPNDYILVEDDETSDVFIDVYKFADTPTVLTSIATRFMYLERNNKE